MTLKIDIPKTLHHPHPVVLGWLQEHKTEQKKIRESNKDIVQKNGWRTVSDLPDLTKRDRYRFRVTSAFLFQVEAEGWRVLDGDKVKGRLSLEIDDTPQSIVIIERMKRHTGSTENTFSAFGSHTRSGLVPTGFLRFTPASYGAKELVETSNKSADVVIPKVLIALKKAAAKAKVREAEKLEYDKAMQLRRDEMAKAKRLREADEKRFSEFRGRAVDWQEAGRLRRFVNEVKDHPDKWLELGLDKRGDWLTWIEQKISKLDPLNPRHEL